MACVASAVAFSLWSNGLFSTIVAVYALWLGWLARNIDAVEPRRLSRLGRDRQPVSSCSCQFRAGSAQSAPYECRIISRPEPSVFTIALLEIAAATFRRSVLARQQAGTGKLAQNTRGALRKH